MKKKTALGLILGAAAAVTLPVFLAAPGRAGKAQKAPFLGWNFAHRGLHRADKSVPENSLEAFRLAEEAGYGVELDVQLSQDGQVVVFHDDTLDRVCSVHGRVDAFPYEQLRQMSLCGTEQHIPLFSQVLEVFGGRGPLLVELKTGPRNRELCEKTLALLEGYRGEVCIESSPVHRLQDRSPAFDRAPVGAAGRPEIRLDLPRAGKRSRPGRRDLRILPPPPPV